MKFIVLVLAFVCLAQARHVRDVDAQNQNMINIEEISSKLSKVVHDIAEQFESTKKVIQENAEKSGLQAKVQEVMGQINQKIHEWKEDLRKKEPQLVQGAEKVHEDTVRMTDEVIKKMSDTFGQLGSDVQRRIEEIQKNPEMQDATKKLQEFSNYLLEQAKTALTPKKD